MVGGAYVQLQQILLNSYLGLLDRITLPPGFMRTLVVPHFHHPEALLFFLILAVLGVISHSVLGKNACEFHLSMTANTADSRVTSEISR